MDKKHIEEREKLRILQLIKQDLEGNGESMLKISENLIATEGTSTRTEAKFFSTERNLRVTEWRSSRIAINLQSRQGVG